MNGTTVTELRYPGGYSLGDYEIRRFLGSGAAGDVYVARHRLLENDVALKVIRPPAAQRWQEQDAKTICRLRHPNIVSVHAAERIEDRPVLVMDLVAGKPLRKVLSEQGRLEIERALRIACAVTSALEYVHKFETENSPFLAHLALNPSNIFLDRNGMVRISDFGVARAFGAGISSPGDVGSSPVYVAPEQFEGRPSAQSDIWAVGVLLHEMLLGSTPFRNGSFEECRVSICSQDPEYGLEFADLAAPMRDVIRRCLQRDLQQRFVSASELAAGLAAVCVALGLVKCSKCGEDLLPESDVCPECSFADLRESISRRQHASHHVHGATGIASGSRRLAVFVLLAIAVVVSGGYWLWQSTPGGSPAHSGTTQSAEIKPDSPSPPPGVKATAGNVQPSGLPGTTIELPKAATAVSRQWEAILALDSQPGGTYEERIERLRKFLESYPDSAESGEAKEKLRAWDDERVAFDEAEEFERKPGSKMCAILAAWQSFLTRQASGLCYSHALNRMAYWRIQIENYSGYAELTIHSAQGLPLADNYLLYKGKPEPYFVLFWGDKVLYRSRTIDSSTSPSWDEKVRIYVLPGTNLDVQIWDEDLFGSELLAQLPLMPLPLDGPFKVTKGSILVNAEIHRDR